MTEKQPSQNAGSSQNQGKPGKGTGPPRTKNVQVAAKLFPNMRWDASFVGSSNSFLKDCFVLVLAGGVSVRQLTYHHPIGFTDLGEDEWVASETSEINTLIARAGHPDEKSTEAKRLTARYESAVTASLLVKTGDEYFYPAYTGESRSKLLSAAKKAAKEAAGEGNKSKVSDADVRARLLSELQSKEAAVRSHMATKEVIDASVAAFPLPAYETKGGPYADRPQTAVAFLSKKSKQQALDLLLRRSTGLE